MWGAYFCMGAYKGTKSAERVFGEHNTSPHEVSEIQTTASFCGCLQKFLNEATTDMVLLAAIEQVEDQTTTRVLIAALWEYEDSGTTQKEDVKKQKVTINSLYVY